MTIKTLIKPIAGMLAIVFSSPILGSSVSDSHYYISAYAGIFQGNFNNSFLDQTSAVPQNIAQTAEQHGYIGGFAVGNSIPFWQQYFVGGEFAGNIDSHIASTQDGITASNVFSDKVQVKQHLDLTIVPGVALTETVGTYIKLGLSYAFLKDTLSSPTSSTNTIYSSNKNALGFAAGFGLEKFINDKVFLFLEGVYHDYGTVNFSNFQTSAATYSHATHVYTYSCAVGAGYTI